jgi:ubiquinone/menaquinone biosynthesis C-methylase UbiE
MNLTDTSKLAAEVFNACAEQYQSKFMNLDNYHDTFDFFCDTILPQQAKVLDIACGPGNITQYLLKKRPDLNILGIDLAPVMVELAKNNNPSANFRVMDGRNINSLDQTFDALICGFCLPYLNRRESTQLIADAAGMLNPGGVFYLSTMEGDYEQSGWKASSDGKHSTFTHYYAHKDLLTALERMGFEQLKTYRKEYKEANGTITIDLIIISQKQF